MQYKTIVLELLKLHPTIYEHLRSHRTLLSTVEFYARRMRTSHKAWKMRLSQTMPESNQSQIASQALELAINDLGSLASPMDDQELSLEGAMAFIRARTRPA